MMAANVTDVRRQSTSSYPSPHLNSVTFLAEFLWVVVNLSVPRDPQLSNGDRDNLYLIVVGGFVGVKIRLDNTLKVTSPASGT